MQTENIVYIVFHSNRADRLLTQFCNTSYRKENLKFQSLDPLLQGASSGSRGSNNRALTLC